MKAEFAQQYNVPCVVLFGGETFEEVTARCRLDEAIFDDGEDECYVVRFPGRPQELYTAQALQRSLPPQTSPEADLALGQWHQWRFLQFNLGCSCRRSDAWRCAVELGLSTVSCSCKCHRYLRSDGGNEHE